MQGELHNDADAGQLQASDHAALFCVAIHLPVRTTWLDVYKTADLCMYTLTTMFSSTSMPIFDQIKADC